MKKENPQSAKWQQENSNINALDFEIDSLKREIKVLRHQQERRYSEEEVLELLNKREDYINSEDNIFEYQSAKKWLEQFKKK